MGMPDTPENREIEDLSVREMAILSPLVALMIVIGWNPTPLLERMEPSVRLVLERVESAAPAASAALPSELPVPGTPVVIPVADPTPDESQAEVRGRDLMTGLPKTVILTPEEVRYAIEDVVSSLPPHAKAAHTITTALIRRISRILIRFRNLISTRFDKFVKAFHHIGVF